MNGGEYRGLYQTAVSQRHEIVMAVDQVEFSRMLEDLGNMQVLGYLRID